MNKNSNRLGRIDEELKKEISNIITYDLKNPNITGMISVTRAKITPDLKYAQVYVSILNSRNIKETFASLAKEYSDDSATKNDGGALGYINLNNLGTNYDELVNAAVKLKDGKYSTSVITTDLGYHVIYRVDQKDKGKSPLCSNVEWALR
mgnify:CR=1 FL=1